MVLKFLLQVVFGLILFERKMLRLDFVIKFKEDEEVEKLNVGSNCGEEYLKKFDVVVFKILF